MQLETQIKSQHWSYVHDVFPRDGRSQQPGDMPLGTVQVFSTGDLYRVLREVSSRNALRFSQAKAIWSCA